MKETLTSDQARPMPFLPCLTAIALALLLGVFVTPVRAEQTTELDVMSFNIRFAHPGHSEPAPVNNWNDPSHPRRERAIRVIRDNLPDLLGAQEVRAGQLEDLREALPEFDHYGVGRDDGQTRGESVPIFYRRDRFERIAEGTFWLSDTPDSPGTTFSEMPRALPRIASWLELRDKATGKKFLVLNAHWDHIDAKARRQSARLIRDRLEELAPDLPVIVMGDFNAREENPEVVEIIAKDDSSGRQLVDTYRQSHPERSPEEATFNAFSGSVLGSRIDYILATPEWSVLSAEIVRTSYDDFYPSDHYPVTATLRLAGDRNGESMP